MPAEEHRYEERQREAMTDRVYLVWDYNWDEPLIAGIYFTREEAVAHSQAMEGFSIDEFPISQLPPEIKSGKKLWRVSRYADGSQWNATRITSKTATAGFFVYAEGHGTRCGVEQSIWARTAEEAEAIFEVNRQKWVANGTPIKGPFL
jgi:hypothetical protein